MHPWPKLVRLLARLPPESQFRADQAMDTELAAQWADQYDPDQPAPAAPVTPHGYTLTAKLLVLLCNRMERLEAVLLAVHGNHPGRLNPIPLPTNALEIELLRRDDAAVDEALIRLGAHDI